VSLPSLVVVAIVASVAGAAAARLARARRRRGGEPEPRDAEAGRAFQALALSRLGEAVVGVDTSFAIRAWNQAAERLYGWTAAEVVGRSVHDVFPTETPDGGGTREIAERLAALRQVHTAARRRRKDGTWFDAEISIAAVEDGRGRVTGWVGIHRDVTEQKRREEAIRAAEAKIDLLTSVAPAGIFQTDGRGSLTFVNDQLCALTGLPPERLRRGWLRAIHRGDRARVAREWKEAWAQGRAFRAELRFGRGDDVTWVYVCAMPLRNAEGGTRGGVGVVTDVTEARRVKERLACAERLASLGTLSSGMAHEVNNPLASVMANLSFIAAEVQGRDELADAADAAREAQGAAARVARIVRELQAVAGPRGEAGPLDLRAAVHGALEIVPEALKRRAGLALDLGEVPPVAASEQQAERILYHLLANAFQAIPDERAGRGEVRARTRTAPDGRAVVEIEDDGRGIAAEHLHRIFDPFFTTRAVGQGTGLGLSVCHGLVRVLEGEMEVESRLGKGSTFRVVLPAAAVPGEEPAAAPAPAGADAAPPAVEWAA
jgi:PAS domain S-box-containing protein